MPITRTPVAIGSKVPAWPTLRVSASLRQRATTSCDVQPDGLSTTRTPSGAAISLGAERVGAVAFGAERVGAVKWSAERVGAVQWSAERVDVVVLVILAPVRIGLARVRR